MNQPNVPINLPFVDVHPQPLPVPSVEDPMAQLAAIMAQLANVSAMSLANSLSKAKAVQKLSPFKGEQESDTHRFLAA